MLFLVICFTIAAVDAASDWNYDNSAKWGTIADKQCDGNRQSPIQIWRNDVKVDTSIAKLKFIEYNNPITGETIVNNGHTVKISITDGLAQITGATLPDAYVLKQFHFHWANSDSDGSEHGVGSEKYPLELHLVHTRKGVSIGEALDDKDQKGLAVVGVKFTITPKNNTAIAQIIKYFGEITHKNQSTQMSPFGINLFHYLPEDAESNFFLYDGSLTTPPCTETVQWIVLAQYATVSSSQMAEFRRLFQTTQDSSDPHHMMNTNRPVQKLNKRTIKTRNYFYIPERLTSGTASHFLSVGIVMTILLSVL